MSPQDPIEKFFQSPSFGVVGASTDSTKFGHRVLMCYRKHGLTAYPINPRESEIEGQKCFASVKDLPADVKSLSIITPPAVTEKIVREAVEKGVQNIWMQPGAESLEAVRYAEENGLNVIADGSCLLVILPRRK